jgi:hypothetical protein
MRSVKTVRLNHLGAERVRLVVRVSIVLMEILSETTYHMPEL